MIRPVTCICMMLAAGSGLYLYQVKHRTEVLDRTIEQTLKATETVHERTRLLSAEWALLNDPSRLSDMAARFLNLRPVAPNQFVTMAELDKHLPPTQSYPPPGAPQPLAETPMADAAPPAPPAMATVEPVHPPALAAVTPPAHPQTLAAAKPVAHAVAEARAPEAKTLEAKAPERHEPERHESQVAALPTPHATIGAVPGPMATPVSNPVMINPVLSRVMATNPPPRPSREPEYTSSNYASSNLGAATPSPVRNTHLSTYPTSHETPRVASALGGARSMLAPPVPVSGVSDAQ